MRRFFRTIYYLAGTLFFLAIAAIGFTQTKTFRTYLHERVTKLLSQELHTDIQLGELEGNLFTSVRIENVALGEPNSPILQADVLEARYEPMGVFLNRITFSDIKLTNPVIRLVRSNDGTWNIDRIFAPASADSSLKPPSDVVVSLKDIQLDNASFSIKDSLKMRAFDTLTTKSVPVGIADYPVLELQGIKLNASVRVDTRGVDAVIDHLSFVSEQPALVLKRLSGQFVFGASGTHVQKLLVETAESRFAADATIQHVNITTVSDVEELQQKPLRATVTVERLSLAELRRLFPSALKVLDKQVAVQARISGSLDRLQVEHLSVRTPRSFVAVEGTLTNLHRPETMQLDLVCVNNKLDPAELPVYLPTIKLPDMSSMGELKYNLRFTGSPSAFVVRFEGQSNAGGLVADASMEFKHDSTAYSAKITTSAFNLGALFGDEGLTSRLNSTLVVEGNGFDPQSMKATARVDVDSSEFYGISMGASTVTAEISNSILRTRAKLSPGKAVIDLSGTARLQRGEISRYNVNGTVSSLDLAPLLKGEHYTSNLSFGIRLEGAGLTFGDMQTKINLAFGHSSFSGQEFAETQLEAEINAVNPTNQTFHLSSEVADIDIEGKFELDSFISTLHKSGLLIAEAIDHRLGSLVSLRGIREAMESEAEFESSLQSIPQPVDARYTIVVRDFYPVGVFLGYRMAGSGVVSGEVSGSLDALRLKGSAGLDAFAYADNTISIGAYGADLSYSIDDASRATILDAVHAKVDFASKRLEVNALPLLQPSLSVDIQGPAGTYEIYALVDSSVGINASGTSLYRNGFIRYTLDTLTVDAQSYSFANIQPVVATLGQDGLQVGNLWMRHEAEEVKLSGIFNPVGISNLEFHLVNFQLSNLQLLSANSTFVRDVRALTGRVNASGTFSGPFENPVFSFNMAAHDVHHGKTPFGQVLARASYANRMLDLFVELRSKPDDATLSPDFILTGYLPYDMALAKRAQQPLEGEMNLTMKSSGLRLQLLDPFIGELSNLTGSMISDVAIRGTLEQPRYEGSLSLQEAQFYFTPLGITYRMDGRLVPDGQRIGLENFRVNNIELDRPDGAMDFSGSFTLDGLKLKDFDLLAYGQLLVLKETARQPGQGLYGNIFAAVGSNGLRWQGTPARSVVSGKIYIKNANLTLPPTRDVLVNTNRDVIVTVVDDTSRTQANKAQSTNTVNGTNGNGSPLLAMNNGGLGYSSNGKSIAQDELPDDGRSFLDRLVYDLDIETQGPTYVRFIFNPYTGEELFADLKGRMVFSKDGNQTRLTGEVEVGDRSYYNFLKRFQATGKLTFTGDALNPELNILATYEGPYQSADTTKSNGVAQNQQPLFKATKVIVKLQITGTRQEPRPTFAIEMVDAVGTREERAGDVESDAISFILTGSLRDELTQQERSSLLGPNLLYGLTSSVLSGPISEFIKKEFGFVSSVDVIYYGGDVQSSTDVRVTGEVGEAVIRFGGRVFSDLGNANASVQLPMSSVLGSESWRNLIIEVERRVEGMESYEQRRELNGIRLIYRITF